MNPPFRFPGDPRFSPEDSAENSPTSTSSSAQPDVPDPGIRELHQEFIAATSEARRGDRRMFEILKNFGGMLEAISATALDTHKAVRALPAAAAQGSAGADASSLPTDWALALVDLADRIDRILSGFDRPPESTGEWWPGTRKTAASWREAWDMQAAAFSILHSHIQSLLSRAGLQRMDFIDKPFDPQTMTAVEAVVDPALPDHTVVGVLLPGWRCATSDRVIRPAQVKVSRKTALSSI